MKISSCLDPKAANYLSAVAKSRQPKLLRDKLCLESDLLEKLYIATSTTSPRLHLSSIYPPPPSRILYQHTNQAHPSLPQDDTLSTMPGLTSASGVLGFLSDTEPELKVFALQTLNDDIDTLWTEVAGSVGQM